MFCCHGNLRVHAALSMLSCMQCSMQATVHQLYKSIRDSHNLGLDYTHIFEQHKEFVYSVSDRLVLLFCVVVRGQVQGLHAI